MTTFVHPAPLLALTLRADAAVSAAAAALQLALAGGLATLLALPQVLIVETGLFLVGYAVLLALLARAGRVPAVLVKLIVAGNLAWAAAALGLAAWLAPSGLGIAYLVLQAVAVTVLAVLEWRGLARSAAAGVARRPVPQA